MGGALSASWGLPLGRAEPHHRAGQRQRRPRAQVLGRGCHAEPVRLKDEGIFARALPAVLTHTSTDWATISTGAWPRTYSVTGFSVVRRERSYRVRDSGFDTRVMQAEFIWQAAEGAELKCIPVK